jgi:glycosyltransferase involved in cell wall biosynthesis
VVFGAEPADGVPDLGMSCSILGTFRDDAVLAQVYAAADVFVAPSTQENLSNTVMEALTCGTPVVAFDVGGMGDMVEDRLNGYLAQPFQADDLARGIAWILDDPTRRTALSRRAREKAVVQFASQTVAQQHGVLYEQIGAGARETAVGT